jgi:hypothetical protein
MLFYRGRSLLPSANSASRPLLKQERTHGRAQELPGLRIAFVDRARSIKPIRLVGV